MKFYSKISVLFLLLIVVAMSGCMSDSLSCSSCNSNEFTGTKGDYLYCDNCNSMIKCPKCNEPLILAGTLESDGVWHDEGVCNGCDERYRIN